MYSTVKSSKQIIHNAPNTNRVLHSKTTLSQHLQLTQIAHWNVYHCLTHNAQIQHQSIANFKKRYNAADRQIKYI